jgi:hypothetical protein
LSLAWLKIEEGKNERALPSEEKREGKSKMLELPSRGPCSPFYQTRGAGYINAMGQARREGVCMSNRCMGASLFLM